MTHIDESAHNFGPPTREVTYRPDIDGLRALAVLAIVAFHLGVSRISGGFVGVDIFYVISGFLIGSIVIRELQEGTFSIVHFYQRRLKRILPALVIVLLFTTIVAFFILFPPELYDYANSMIATALWTANLYFWATTNYFLVDKVTPLLHCWSLGVEEQYYLFFPLLTILIFRLRPTSFRTIFGVVAAGSLMLSVSLTTSAPMANFYLLPTRAWELLLGVLTAITSIKQLDWRPLREAMGGLGLALIIVPILWYTPGTQFPGLNALPPCFGTAAVIASGARGRNSASMLLSARPLVFFGLISYSLYLWHWPIIAFILRDLPAVHLDRATKVAALVLILILAALTWQFVEKPFRASKKPAKFVFLYSTGAVTALSVIAVIVIASYGFPSRYDRGVASLASVLGYNYQRPFRAHQCFLDAGDTIKTFDRNICLVEVSNEPNVLLIGDSHAAHLWRGLQTVFDQTNVMQATAAICRPFYFKQATIGQWQNIDEYLKRCNLLMSLVYDDYLVQHHPDLVILAARWFPEDEEGLARTLDWLRLKNFTVILTGPDPNWYLPVPMLMAMAAMRNDPGLVDRNFDASRGALDARFAALAAAHGAKYVSAYAAFCGVGNCRVRGDSGLPLMFDYGHLTTEGSELVAKRFNDPSLRR
jgi:peptidoglycan/LPS O-acetylase OafA/YrhL